MRILAAALTLVCFAAQAQDARQAPPTVTSLENVEAYVGYLRLAARARACGLRTAEWEKARQQKVTELIVRAMSIAPPSATRVDGASLAAGAMIAAGQEARSLGAASCEAAKPLIDELDVALPQDPPARP